MTLEKTLTTPEAQQSVDKVRMQIKKVDPEKKILEIELHKGFIESDVFKLVEIKKVFIMKDDYDEVMDTEGVTGTAVRETLASAIWAWLQANGKIDVQ